MSGPGICTAHKCDNTRKCEVCTLTNQNQNHSIAENLSSSELCCCEYINSSGDRSHILICCCDCEALDETFERLVTCRNIPEVTSSKLMKTIDDRCRVPWVRSGAMKIRVDTVIPVVVIPLYLTFATIHFYATIVALIFMPLTLLVFHRQWRKRHARKRTKMFLSWALTSIVLMLIIFETFILPFRKILMWEHLLFLSSTFLLFYFMNVVRCNTSSIKPNADNCGYKNQGVAINNDTSYTNQSVTSPDQNIDQTQPSSDYTDLMSTHPVGQTLVNNFGFDLNEFRVNLNEVAIITESMVTWIDSRPIIDGCLVTRCQHCDIERPARSGHCTLCHACIHTRDHHCVWLDVCIGATNHRAFFITLALFLWSALYGSHLTLTTICIPEIYFNWFLLPSQCDLVYSDFSNAICYVGACYTLMVTAAVTLLLLHQIALISQNVTSQELHRARLRGLTRYWLWAQHNMHNEGFLHNWYTFLVKPRRPASVNIPM